jgi:hypothetical protein
VNGRSRSLSGRVLVVAALLACSVATGLAGAEARGPEAEARVITDGHLRVGHLETMRVRGLPGKGVVWVSFFPTALCEDGCGALAFLVGRSDARGTVKFRVRIPGTFFDHGGRHVYFRDGERIDVNLTWEGPNRSFATGSAWPEPIVVRSHRGRDD